MKSNDKVLLADKQVRLHVFRNTNAPSQKKFSFFSEHAIFHCYPSFINCSEYLLQDEADEHSSKDEPQPTVKEMFDDINSHSGMFNSFNQDDH